MKLSPSKTAILAAILAGSAAIASPPPAGDFSFRDPPLHSMGVKSLSDLRGKPIVIDFWGRN